MHSDITRVVQQAVDQHLYGIVEIHFQNGKVVLLKKSEHIKPTVEGVNNNAKQPNRQ